MAYMPIRSALGSVLRLITCRPRLSDEVRARHTSVPISRSCIQDWPAGGGAGFFGRCLAPVARDARQKMVSKDHKLSVRRQCALLTLSRSNLYYEPKGESAENLRFMEIIDKQFLGDAVVRVATDGPSHEAQRPQMRAPSCPPFDAPHAVGSDLSGTQHQQEAPAA